MTNYEEMYVTHRYAQEVVDGLRRVCKKEYLACLRHLNDLERQGTEEFPYVFDETRADRIFDWFENYCYHVRGPFSGQLIQLLPFQYFDLGCVFGWVHMVTGKRRFSTSFNLRARGNVKSTEMSGIALYGMCADAIYPPYRPELAKFEQMPEVECAAVDRDQAKRVWGDARLMGEKSAAISKYLSFIPEEAVQIHEKKDNVPYRSWIRDDWVTETPGAVVDYDTMSEYVDNFINFMGKKPNEDCFDPYNATFYMIKLGEKGERTPVEVRQNTLSLSEPTNWLRELIVSRKVVHDGNPLLTWALSNAYAYTDGNGNIKLSKKNKDDTQRIDPAAALINALSRLPKAQPKRSKYEDCDLSEW